MDDLNLNRFPFGKLGNLQLYRVKIADGPHAGTLSICSHDVVYVEGERYERGVDDLYYHKPLGVSWTN